MLTQADVLVELQVGSNSILEPKNVVKNQLVIRLNVGTMVAVAASIWRKEP